ncbi:MAG TPA: alpha-ketoglutarate-dependent dioxygenase AlkB [Puia sp.]|nr:alpha-ketoglutarate-dependent dioxygenase AlkB [Puia sp.]
MEQLSLFNEEKNNSDLPADLIYIKNFIQEEESQSLLQKFIGDLPWQQTERILYGKKIITPRLTVWYGDTSANYSLSSDPSFPLPWTDELLDLKNRVVELSGVRFNTVLLNYYRNGNDSVAWHTDNDGIPGRNKTVASVSLGQTRRFDVRNYKDHSKKYSIMLESGSYLLMTGSFQDEWQHRVPKSATLPLPRVNLTFRLMPINGSTSSVHCSLW